MSATENPAPAPAPGAETPAHVETWNPWFCPSCGATGEATALAAAQEQHWAVWGCAGVVEWGAPASVEPHVAAINASIDYSEPAPAKLLEMADAMLRDFGPPLRIVTGMPGVPCDAAWQTVEIEECRWLLLGDAVWQALLDRVPTVFHPSAPRGGMRVLTSIYGAECEVWNPRRPDHIELWRAIFGEAVAL